MIPPDLLLNEALVYAVSQVQELSHKKPNERLPKEAVLQCAIYHFYMNKGYFVHPESAYFPAGKKKNMSCDLRVIGESELWIELKTARDARGLISKIDEEKEKWEKDGSKLDNSPPNSRAAFVLFTFTEDNPENSNKRIFKEINKLWDGGYGFTKVVTADLTWPKSEIKFITVWYWVW